MNKFFETFENVKEIKKHGILKGYKNGLYGQATILLDREINKDYTIADFHADRCYLIDMLRDYTNFETELKTL